VAFDHFPNKRPRASEMAEGTTDKEHPLAATPTIQDTRPHICGSCENPIAPYRWAGFEAPTYGRQCNCPEPSSPTAVSDGVLCFITKDSVELQAPKPIDVEVDTDSVERMRIEMGATVADLVAGDIEESRQRLHEAAKVADRNADQPGATILRRILAERISDLDDLRSFVSGLGQS